MREKLRQYQETNCLSLDFTLSSTNQRNESVITWKRKATAVVCSVTDLNWASGASITVAVWVELDAGQKVLQDCPVLRFTS